MSHLISGFKHLLGDIDLTVATEFYLGVGDSMASAPLTPSYQVMLDGEACAVEPGMGITLSYRGPARCRFCGAALAKRQPSGACYDCFTTLARCDLCLVSPETCHHHEGTCREPAWAEDFCMQPHAVYLSITSGPKVGITRAERLLHRFVDQGASQAVAIARTASRRTAGYVEAYLKRSLADATDWRKLVTGLARQVDLLELAAQLIRGTPDLQPLAPPHVGAGERAGMGWVERRRLVRIDYPIQRHAPARMLRVGPDHPELKGDLKGIVGGYLLMDQGAIAVRELTQGDVHMSVGAPFGQNAPADAQGSLFDS